MPTASSKLKKKRTNLWTSIRVVKVTLSLCLTKYHAMKTYWGRRGIAPRILELGTGWKLSGCFTLWGKSTRYPLYRRLGGSQIRRGRGAKRKNPIISTAENWTLVVQPIACSLYWLIYTGSFWWNNPKLNFPGFTAEACGRADTISPKFVVLLLNYLLACLLTYLLRGAGYYLKNW
jgi:hypothetical protein